jgi:hypothetical protein
MRWLRRTFKTRAAMERFIARWPDYEFIEIVVNNGYGVWFRRLRG